MRVFGLGIAAMMMVAVPGTAAAQEANFDWDAPSLRDTWGEFDYAKLSSLIEELGGAAELANDTNNREYLSVDLGNNVRASVWVFCSEEMGCVGLRMTTSIQYTGQTVEALNAATKDFENNNPFIQLFVSGDRIWVTRYMGARYGTNKGNVAMTISDFYSQIVKLRDEANAAFASN
ncbi:hypothetical protein [Sphingomicrobium sediminis]|uniref:YbjN domain-containing protein n=1 Tax=Sphingomicrobium sediminis TaxID=2950949 RepID=A0A9X2J459_9SPHN|nr:hypothetical protein [Sphingomicrobium sediminis]MCM8556887.1 hypothetical protein [Sphingomicrobium sediminis]